MEDVWRGEAQDLLSQIAQLQEENKSLLTNLSVRDPLNEEDLQRHEGARTCCSNTPNTSSHPASQGCFEIYNPQSAG